MLWPFRTLAQLPLADSPRTFLVALPWALLLLVLNYVWILRTDVPFEEAAAELSEKIEKIRRQGLSALRKPRRPTKTPFHLAPIGRPETAIVWKNLIAMGRVLSWTVLLRFAPMLVITRWRYRAGARTTGFLAIASLMVAGFTMILGPQMARRDCVRISTLCHAEDVAIRGAGLVRGELMAPAIVLTTIAWLALIVAAGWPRTHRSRRTSEPMEPARRSDVPCAGLVRAGNSASPRNASRSRFRRGCRPIRALAASMPWGRKLVMLAVLLALVVAVLRPRWSPASLAAFSICCSARFRSCCPRPRRRGAAGRGVHRHRVSLARSSSAPTSRPWMPASRSRRGHEVLATRARRTQAETWCSSWLMILQP